MLDFYGMRLVDEETGQLARSEEVAPSSASWRVRYSNLTRNMHNFLRITRIMKSNSEVRPQHYRPFPLAVLTSFFRFIQFGQEHLNAPFLLFFLVEQARGELNSTSLTRSMDNYWRWCIRNDEEREFVGEMIGGVREEEGKWTEEMYVEALERRKKMGSFRAAQVDGDKEEVAEVKDGESPPKEETKRERTEGEVPDGKKVKTDCEEKEEKNEASA